MAHYSFPNVPGQVSLLASGAEGAQAASVTEVPKGQGLTAPARSPILSRGSVASSRESDGLLWNARRSLVADVRLCGGNISDGNRSESSLGIIAHLAFPSKSRRHHRERSSRQLTG